MFYILFIVFYYYYYYFFYYSVLDIVSKPNDKRQHKQDFIKSSRDRNSQI